MAGALKLRLAGRKEEMEGENMKGKGEEKKDEL